jgi:hypothetical protein
MMTKSGLRQEPMEIFLRLQRLMRTRRETDELAPLHCLLMPAVPRSAILSVESRELSLSGLCRLGGADIAMAKAPWRPIVERGAP